jgi:hypothetical protein
MIFNRTYTFKSSHPKNVLHNKLVGQRIQIHNMDFEVMEKNDMLKVIPHAENSTELKILPITHLKMETHSNDTTITLKSKPRRIDVGGPYLLVIFCIFIIIIGLGFFIFQPGTYLMPAIMAGSGVLVFGVFWFKMQTSYFDYIRKIKSHIKTHIQ